MDVCVHFCGFCIDFDIILGLFFDHLGSFGALFFWLLASIYWLLGNLEGIRASPGHGGVPLGARVFPRRVQGAKNWFVGPPLGSQNGAKFILKVEEISYQKSTDFLNAFL